MTGLAALSGVSVSAAPTRQPRVLIIVAHPDDEYAFAATVYRITREFGGTVDQVVLTNGEAGYRYSRLAESVYNASLTDERVGRSKLPAIRREETLRAGRILGIRHHWFFEQKDARFTLNGNEAFDGIWNVLAIRERLAEILTAQTYDFVFTLLPTRSTHGHHQAAALLAIQAVSALPESRRPAVLAAEPSAADYVPPFENRPEIPELRLHSNAQVFQVNRLDSFGPGESLNYSIVVNWVIAEHKSQGLFQTESGKHSVENFWLFDTATPGAHDRAESLFRLFRQRR